MSLIALEEAFSFPGATSLPVGQQLIRVKDEIRADWRVRLADIDKFRLPEMDANDIEIQVLSLTVPGIQALTDPQQAGADAVAANDYLAEVIATHADRFRGFAALPMQDPDAATAELRRTVTDLGFCGALVNGHTNGGYLDDQRYEGFWTELERLDRPLYIHPSAMPVEKWHVIEGYPELYGPLWSWGTETAGHALRLIFGGVFDRHPNARVILGHMGEFLPFQRWRMDSRYRTLDTPRPLDRAPSEYLGTNLLFTTSGVFSPTALEGAVLAVGSDSIMFSVDYPFEDSAEAVAGFSEAGLDPDDREKIGHRNARRLLGI